jgi:outer membrane immunogenic protein
MRTLIFAGSIILVCGAAAAADLQRAAPTPAPVYAPATPYYDWTGFYLGANGGWAEGDSRFNFEGAGLGRDRFDTSGFLAGGTAGYNVQLGHIVFGLEGDVDWSNVNGSSNCALSTLSCQTQNNWLGTARGRIGVAFDRVLPYVTGGLAVGDISANTGAGSASTTNAGWTVGGGLEYGISKNWSAKMEYLHVDLGSFDCGTACNPSPPVNVHVNEDLVRAGLNYRFDWGGSR